MSKTIALLTDFGPKDGFTGTLKGVIHNIYPEAITIDISHDIKPQDIRSASWILNNCYRFFPKETIFVCVVDPGVGSKREHLLIVLDHYIFIGPNNGFISKLLVKSDPQKIIRLENKDYWLPNVTHTFHARDIYAPVAAHLANKPNIINSLGTSITEDEILLLNYKSPKIIDKKITGCIDYIDHFGNLITNIPDTLLTSSKIKIVVNDNYITTINNCYSDVESGELVALIGSHGFLEISVNCGNAQEKTFTKIEDQIIVILDDNK
ncbi:MAG: SAM-dependent chlorinase/fluorinase [Cyanobacteriota bacterium]